MALNGRAFMAIWNDVAEGEDDEYASWHTRQHMPERLGVPGFLAGRRAVDRSLAHQQWFTLYEVRTLEVLTSEDYRARLNSPSHWSVRTQPHFRNFARSACYTAASTGRGIGGALATIRLDLLEDGLARFEAEAEKLVLRFTGLDGVVGAHCGVAAPETTRVKTRETELRAGSEAGEDVFDALVMIEGLGRRELDARMREISDRLAETLPVASARTGVYDLAYLITAADAV